MSKLKRNKKKSTAPVPVAAQASKKPSGPTLKPAANQQAKHAKKQQYKIRKVSLTQLAEAKCFIAFIPKQDVIRGVHVLSEGFPNNNEMLKEALYSVFYSDEHDLFKKLETHFTPKPVPAPAPVPEEPPKDPLDELFEEDEAPGEASEPEEEEDPDDDEQSEEGNDNEELARAED